jgi:hypothetical protein
LAAPPHALSNDWIADHRANQPAKSSVISLAALLESYLPPLSASTMLALAHWL